jgi:hypothetical protein
MVVTSLQSSFQPERRLSSTPRRRPQALAALMSRYSPSSTSAKLTSREYAVNQKAHWGRDQARAFSATLPIRVERLRK